MKSLKGQIKVEETARKKKEKEFKEFTVSSKVYQFKMETQLEESLQMCTMLKQELEKVSVERTLLVREKENSQLLMLHLQNKMQMEEDMQMEDIHLKTKRMNKLEGERFQLQSKYEMLIARNEERNKLLKEKNNVIRNLKQGLQLNINFDYKYNKLSHQKKNTECGIYSLYFLITMLKSKNPELFKEIISDDEISKYRNIYFNKAKCKNCNMRECICN